MNSLQKTDVPQLHRLRDCQIIQLPKISDPRGNLTYAESQRHIPFRIQRAYWIYDVPGGVNRGGGHAYRTQHEFVIALSGSFNVTVDDGDSRQLFTLNRSYFGLYVPSTIWRLIDDFSTNAVALIISSGRFSPDDYVRDRALFLRWRREAA
jgi:hypothetical protein